MGDSQEVIVQPFKAYNEAAQRVIQSLHLESSDEVDSSVLRWHKLLGESQCDNSNVRRKTTATTKQEVNLSAALRKLSKFLSKDQKFVKASKLLLKLIKDKLTSENSKLFLAAIAAAIGNGKRI